MKQSNIVVFSSRNFSNVFNEYTFISIDKLLPISNIQFLNIEDYKNYIIDLNNFFPESITLEELPNYLIHVIDLINKIVLIKSNDKIKKIVFVFYFFDKKIQIVLRSFLIGFLKSAQVECKFRFSFTFVLKCTAITQDDFIFFSKLFTNNLNWFVNNEINLE